MTEATDRVPPGRGKERSSGLWDQDPLLQLAAAEGDEAQPPRTGTQSHRTPGAPQESCSGARRHQARGISQTFPTHVRGEEERVGPEWLRGAPTGD